MNIIGKTVAALVLAAPGLASAQDPGSDPAIEITPHVSLGSAVSSGFGTAVRFPLASKLSVELEAGQRRAELNALTMHVSLLYDLPALGRATPYVAGGAGVEQFGYAVGSPATGIVALARTAFTLNAGGGFRVPVDDRWGVRADARWFYDPGRRAPDRWRVYNGVTVATGRR